MKLKKSSGRKLSRFIGICLWAILLVLAVQAQTLAPNAPGRSAQWATAGKQGVGTSANLESKIWFTLAQGVLTEVYYPDVTVANVHLLQFVVVNPKTKKVETEQADAVHEIKVLRSDSLSFRQINTAKNGAWKITKTYAVDVERDVLMIDVKFETKNKNLTLYAYFDPSLGNSGMGDKAYSPLLQLQGDYEYEKSTVTKDGLKTVKKSGSATVSAGMGSEDGKYAAAVYFSSDIEEATNGYLGTSDGLEQLRKFGKITETYAEATKGNVVQMARIMKPAQFTTIISFADDIWKASSAAAKTYQKGFAKVQAEYDKGWADYIKTIRKVDPRFQAQFNMAAMQLKAHEDKTIRGANIASLSVPWGGGDNADENNIGGYHLIWSRDLYQVATAFMAIGDRDAAVRAVNFLFKVQQKEDGSFPQNSYLDGRPFWGSLQMDEVAYPIILAHELGLFDRETYDEHVKRAADFIVKNGPATPQERWEEEGGYSPSTIAAEIAGLVCAAEIAKRNGDLKSAEIYLKTADEWAANIEKWTVTTNGKYSKEPYYVRITQNGKPDAGEKIELNNGAGFFDEREIVDAGFLELVRLGIKPADDKIIQNSLKVIDQVIRVGTPNGDGFYRYNNDGYGEMDDGRRWNWDGKYTGKGRLWALLSGERGQYELALSNAENLKIDIKRNPADKSLVNYDVVRAERKAANDIKLRAAARLDTMRKFANDGLMIPEQVWDKPVTPKNADRQFVPELKFGEGTGSATPLAWSMAQFIRLAVNLQEGRNLDTPRVVYDRYVLGIRSDSRNELTQSNPLDRFLAKNGNFVTDNPTNQKNSVNPVLFSQIGSPESFVGFNYVGKANDVRIAGDFTGWQSNELMKFDNSKDFSSKILKFPNTARVEYKLIVDGQWITDPLNPNKIDNGVGGENSVLTMPDYRPTSWDKINKDNIYFQHFDDEIDSKTYGKRTLRVFSPFGMQFQELPVLYILDGTDYIKRTEAIIQYQNLLSADKIKPFRLVFIDYKDRLKEYWASDEFARFVATEVVPLIDLKYKTVKTRDGRAIMGASLGGISSVHIALKYPELFGRIGAQSASWWIDNERVVKDLEKLDGKTSYKFYVDDGTLEGVEDSRRAVEILRRKGFQVKYLEGEAGHNWTAWRDRLAESFVALMN